MLRYCEDILIKSINIYSTLKAKRKIQEKLMIVCRKINTSFRKKEVTLYTTWMLTLCGLITMFKYEFS